MASYKVEKYRNDKMVSAYGGGYTAEDVMAICKGYAIDWEKGMAWRMGTDMWFDIKREK